VIGSNILTQKFHHSGNFSTKQAAQTQIFEEQLMPGVDE
jgi:hypothetical protein